MTKLEYGINVDPLDAKTRPARAADLQGLKWVRFVLKCSAASFPDLATAYEHYDPFIDACNEVGVRCLLILNQETFWGNGPWTHGNWPTYANDFADQARQVAAHYQGKNVAYEIWNEGDTKGESSTYVEPEDFAPVLQKAVAGIKSEDPDATVVFGGLASGTESAIRYVIDVRAALEGDLPVDAIGVHPYGHWPPSGEPTIPTGWFAPLEPALRRYSDEFKDIPIWITEIGVSEEAGIGSGHWPKVADYLQETFELIQEHYWTVIPVVIWFAWSDQMRGAGIVDRDGQPKESIYDRFFEVVRGPVDVPSLTVTEDPAGLTPTESGLRVRAGEGTEDAIITHVYLGDRLTAEEPWEQIWAKLGKKGEWIKLRTPGNDIGWAAAWYLKLALDIPAEAPPLVTSGVQGLRVRAGPGLGFPILDHVNPGGILTASESWPGAVAKLGDPWKWNRVRTPGGTEGWSAALFLRLPTAAELASFPGPIPPSQSTTYSEAELVTALEFDREPSFDRLPVCDPSKITSFSGFGPNNFSYLTYAGGNDYYHNLSGLHNGLDFGMPIGMPLCTLDWGVVVHVSQKQNDNPYSAGPFTVIIRHGRYVMVYGHLVGKEQGENVFLREGDIVAPGQLVGLSGTSNHYHHLHFEMRKIRQAYINQLRKNVKENIVDALGQLRDMQANFDLRGWWPTRDYYVNPAPFFAPKLETYWEKFDWPHACTVDQDANDNGYPDHVVRLGQNLPKDYGLYSLRAYGPGEPHFWKGSHTV
jgi:murein DD-endopeptidase MepM/ murein hydrolase activator NlpD